MRKNLLKIAAVSSAAVMALSAGIANAAAANATTAYDVKLSSYTSTMRAADETAAIFRRFLRIRVEFPSSESHGLAHLSQGSTHPCRCATLA